MNRAAHTLTLLILLVLTGLVAAGCADDDEGATGEADQTAQDSKNGDAPPAGSGVDPDLDHGALLAHTWTLADAGELGGDYTFTFTPDGTYSGIWNCNNQSGSWTIAEDDVIHIETQLTTRKACTGASPDWSPTTPNELRIDGDMITVVTSDGEALAELVPRARE